MKIMTSYASAISMCFVVTYSTGKGVSQHAWGNRVLDLRADLAFVKDWLGHANIQHHRLRTAHHSNTQYTGADHLCKPSCFICDYNPTGSAALSG